MHWLSCAQIGERPPRFFRASHHLLGLVRQLQDLFRIPLQTTARLGQQHAFSQPFKQAHAEFGFQGLNLGCNGRLRVIQGLGGAAKIKRFCGREKNSKLLQVHLANSLIDLSDNGYRVFRIPRLYTLVYNHTCSSRSKERGN